MPAYITTHAQLLSHARACCGLEVEVLCVGSVGYQRQLSLRDASFQEALLYTACDRNDSRRPGIEQSLHHFGPLHGPPIAELAQCYRRLGPEVAHLEHQGYAPSSRSN
jgi:hypothetical protein